MNIFIKIFLIHANEYKINIPKYINNIEFFNNEFNKLDSNRKEYYYKKYIEELSNYLFIIKYLLL